MHTFNIRVPTAYSGTSIYGTEYVPDTKGRTPVCYICPDFASSADGPYGLLKGIAERLAEKGILAVTFDTAGCGLRAEEQAAFLEQDMLDLEQIRRYAKAGREGRIGEETVIGFGAGAMTAVMYASNNRPVQKLVLAAPLLTWKNELDIIKGSPKNLDHEGNPRCRKSPAYISELEYMSTPSADGMNAAIHSLAGIFKGEIRAVCGTKGTPGTMELLRAFIPYYERRSGVIEVELVQGVLKREDLSVPQLNMRLSELVTEAVAGKEPEHTEEHEI